MTTPIDLSNFKLVKFGDQDIERNYTNAILQALASQALAPAGVISSVGITTGTSGVPVSNTPLTKNGTIDIGLKGMANVNDAPNDGTTYGRNNGSWINTGASGVAVAQVRAIAALRAY